MLLMQPHLHCILSSSTTSHPPFSSPIQQDSSHTSPLSSLLTLPFLPLDSLLYHTHPQHFMSSLTFSSSLSLPSHTFLSCLCIRRHLFWLHLTPLGNEHQGWAPKGWRARELPQGLVLSFDLSVPRGCLVAEKGGWERAHHCHSKCSLSFNEDF